MSTRKSKRVAAVAKAAKAGKAQPPAKETPAPMKERSLEMNEASEDFSSDESEDSSNISDSSSDSDNDDPNYVRAIRGVDWLKANKAPEPPFGTVQEEVVQEEVESSGGSGSRSRTGGGQVEERSDSVIETENTISSRFQYVEPFVSKKGNTFYRCSLCPSKGPFASEGAVLDFMKGKYFRSVLRNTTRLLNPKAPKTEVEMKERADKKKAKRQEKRKAKTQELTAEQIQRRKEKFQRKKARREERKRSSDLPK